MNIPNARRGFTLIEILVVLTIIGLLTAILMPVFAHARDKARLAACANNLQQLGKACAMYASDSDGLLPPYPSILTCQSGTAGAVPNPALIASINPYAHSSSLWRCPGDSRAFGTNIEWSACAGPLLNISVFTSYIYLGVRETEHGLAPVRIDESFGNIGPSALTLLQDSATCPRVDSSPGFGYEAYNHGGEWNRVYRDGHIKSFTDDCTDPSRPMER